MEGGRDGRTDGFMHFQYCCSLLLKTTAIILPVTITSSTISKSTWIVVVSAICFHCCENVHYPH